jgi:hypothetical protein
VFLSSGVLRVPSVSGVPSVPGVPSVRGSSFELLLTKAISFMHKKRAVHWNGSFLPEPVEPLNT